MKIIFCVGAVVAALLAGCSSGNHTNSDGLQGTWKPVTAELSGQPMTDADLKAVSLKLDGTNYEVIANGHRDIGTYTVDASTQPKSMTVIGTQGPNRGKTFPCIYELQGDTVRICYDLSGAKRPTDFKSPPGTKIFLVTYARKKE